MHINFFSIAILSSAVILQLTAAVLALMAIPYSHRYRYPWIALSLALVFMVERRAIPLYRVLHGESHDLIQDLFGLLISILMAVGLIGLRRLLLSLHEKEEQLTRLAVTDTLTGIANRSHVLDKLKSEIVRAERSGQPLSVLILDLDFFKRINDQHGHIVGDEVLVAITSRCLSQLRAIDIFGRLGGEEFIIVMPGTDQEKAAIAAERIRAICAETPVETTNSRFAMTISIGVTTYVPTKQAKLAETPPEAIVKTLLQQADHALYQAKAKGRNCVKEWH